MSCGGGELWSVYANTRNISRCSQMAHGSSTTHTHTRIWARIQCSPALLSPVFLASPPSPDPHTAFSPYFLPLNNSLPTSSFHRSLLPTRPPQQLFPILPLTSSFHITLQKAMIFLNFDFTAFFLFLERFFSLLYFLLPLPLPFFTYTHPLTTKE